MNSALYTGIVTHRRLRPVAHHLRYAIFMLLVDLDEAVSLNRLRLFGFDRAALMSFHQRDHGGGTRDGLRAWVEQHLAQAGLPPGGRIQVLCMPRVLGHAFNPISVYFCHAPDGALQAMLYEVNNTFGQRHSYLLPVHPGQGPLTQECAKEFHVSPFMDMDLRYRFRVLPPAARVGVFITASDQTGTMLTATFAGPRQCLTDAALARVALRVPFLGLQTVAGIHWEAAKLWFKGLKLRPATRQPAVAVTIGR